MSVKGGPNTVTSGLVLELDAGNIKSYQSGSTTWFDKSGNANNGTLTNGPTFNTGSLGSIVFDGVDDSVIISNYNLDSNPELSVFSWIYPINTSELKWIINKRDNLNDVQWQIAIANNNVIVSNIFAGTPSTVIGTVSSSIAPNLWYNVGFTTGGVTGSNLSFYVNGTLIQSTTLTGNRKTGTRDIIIGRAAWINAFYWNGNISTSTIYNRALTQQEVSQNFNATKGRFGL
jgi:hypothetical protein